jgi:hypothetical protein
LDFESAVCINLDAVAQREHGYAIDRLFEDVFRAAEDGLGQRPTRSFALKEGLSSGGKAVWFSVVAFLPPPLKELLSGKHSLTLVRNIGKKGGEVA